MDSFHVGCGRTGGASPVGHGVDGPRDYVLCVRPTNGVVDPQAFSRLVARDWTYALTKRSAAATYCTRHACELLRTAYASTFPRFGTPPRSWRGWTESPIRRVDSGGAPTDFSIPHPRVRRGSTSVGSTSVLPILALEKILSRLCVEILSVPRRSEPHEPPRNVCRWRR